MPGTRTAPTVNATPTSKLVSIRVIDYQGKLWSDSLEVPQTITNAEIEDLVAEYAAITNTSIYEVVVGYQYTSIADQSNALEQVWNSGADIVRTTLKSPVAQSATMYGVLRAPEDTIFIENTQEVDPTNVDLADYLSALLLAVNGGAAGAGVYEITWLRFTQHAQNNAKIPV